MYFLRSYQSISDAFGMRLNEISDIGASSTAVFPRYPLSATNVDFSIANRSFVLIQQITSEYFSCLFFAIRSASLLLKRKHSFDIPPVVRKTKGVKIMA